MGLKTEAKALVESPFLRRKESRVPMIAYVNLYSPDSPNFELAPTIDVSCHGARVVTKQIWEPNQKICVRSIRGHLNCDARVVYCYPYKKNVFVIGIELYNPSYDWTRLSVFRNSDNSR